MLVRFLRDYRGKLTNETFHLAGTVVDMPNGEAMQLHAASVVSIEEPAAQESQPAKRKRGKRG